MKRIMTGWVFVFYLFSQNLYAVDVPVTFDTPEKETRYYALIEGIRCLVCQNQSLADSHADLAQDLRNEIVQMIDTGKSNKEILQYLVDRYGDFVLYRPPLQRNTWLLWLGPFAFLLIGVVVAIIIIRKQFATNSDNVELTDEQQQQLAELNNDKDKDKT